MGLTFQDKESVVSQLSERLSSAQVVIYAEYLGTKAKDFTALRKNARENGVYLKVLKNTLVRRAVQGTSFDVLSAQVSGALLYAIGSDPVLIAKILYEFSISVERGFSVKGGVLSGKHIDFKEIKVLATLPPRAQLLALLMGTMQAPVSQFVRVLNEVPSRFVRTLAAVRDQRTCSTD